MEQEQPWKLQKRKKEALLIPWKFPLGKLRYRKNIMYFILKLVNG